MCGICGLIDRNGVSEQLLIAMRDTLAHRGPDDAGAYFDHEAGVGLGHRRLSIIDLSACGRQPLANEDSRIHAVVNGEFYGYRAQQATLATEGHRFASRSDSEILLHLYEERGAECVQEIRGMFAFGLWDSRRRIVLMARDRVGKKPLYYAHVPGRFAFASEMKALMKLDWVDTAIDPTALDEFLALGYVSGSHTIFAGIRRLEPACVLTYDQAKDRVDAQRYWSLPEMSSTSMSEHDALAQLTAKLQEAVALRLVSDVPVGVFLSGGVDSSLVAALAAEVSDEPLRTFTIGFSEASHDESLFAGEVAKHIGSEHHEITVTPDTLALVDELPAMFDEPFADSSAIPTFCVSQATAGQVKVALSGDGGDELFAGYNWYEWMLRAERIARLLGPLSRPVARAGERLLDGRVGSHFSRSVGLGVPERFIERTFFFSREERSALLAPHIAEALRGQDSPEMRITTSLPGGADLLDVMRRTDFLQYLPDDILTKVDRTSMAVGLEVRCPLLDQDVVEFAYRVPSDMHIAGGRKKALLKRLAARVLPAGFDLERKQGFTMPVGAWLHGDFGDTVRSRVLDSTRLATLIDSSQIDRLLPEHRQGLRDHTSRIWALLVLATWMESRP